MFRVFLQDCSVKLGFGFGFGFRYDSLPQVRRAMGFAFGAAGRAIYSGLVLWDSQVRLLAPSL